jgi:hypothetical protein
MTITGRSVSNYSASFATLPYVDLFECIRMSVASYNGNLLFSEITRFNVIKLNLIITIHVIIIDADLLSNTSIKQLQDRVTIKTILKSYKHGERV